MLKGFFLLVLPLYSFLSLSVTDGDAILGFWKSEADGRMVEMEILKAADGSFYGKQLAKPNALQPANSMLKMLRYDSQKKNYSGIMTPPDTKMTLNVTATMNGKDELIVVAKKFFVTKKIIFVRIKK